jgi:uncharacterized membrane protein
MPDVIVQPALREPAGRVVDAGRAIAWLTEGWKSFMAAPAVWVGITVVLVVIVALMSMVPVVGGLAQAFLFPVFIGGLMMGCRAQEAGEPLAFETLFAGFRRGTNGLLTVGIISFAGTAAIVLVLVLVGGGGVAVGALLGGADGFGAGATVALGSLLIASLLALALLVPLTMAVWFAPPLVALGGQSAGVALRASFTACLKNWLPFLVYGVLTFVLMFIAVLPVGLGLLVLIPVLVGSLHASYKDIFE